MYSGCRRFGLDLSLLGHGKVLLLIGGAVFVVPGFLFGASLAGARQRTRLVAVALGAAIGMAAWPVVAEANGGVPLRHAEVFQEPWAWRLVWIGTLLASAGEDELGIALYYDELADLEMLEQLELLEILAAIEEAEQG